MGFVTRKEQDKITLQYLLEFFRQESNVLNRKKPDQKTKRERECVHYPGRGCPEEHSDCQVSLLRSDSAAPHHL